MNIPEQRRNDIIGLFETLKPADIAQLGDWYTPEACFKDPFKQVQGVAEIQAIFAHMFTTLQNPRFVVSTCIAQDNACFVVWDFLFRFKATQRGLDQCIRGCSHLVFKQGNDGVWRIDMHRDYWDAAEEMYEKFPLIGSLMRWLKKQVNNS
ncbi:MAG: nuclear transport factor 2 family protein [Betaproteobacteria bacterium]|nr:nuclear transport factor 2 family protein [Betaproteobacteria bacterium]